MTDAIRKDPNAPAVVARMRNRLRGVVVNEIASVAAGANQLADVILTKSRVEKSITVELDQAASAGEAHAHGPLEMPDGEISAGTWRSGPGGEEDHDHTVTLSAPLAVGNTVTVQSSPGGPTPHQHAVRITAREREAVQQSRNTRLLARLAKAATDGPIDWDQLETLVKEEDRMPRTFAEEVQDRRVDFLDGAFDERAHALMWTTFGILHSDEIDKERLVLEAVDAYTAAMHTDVPQLFSGQLAKGLTEFLQADTPPAFSDVQQRVEKLLPPGGSGGVMKLFENVSKEERVALDKMWEAAQVGGPVAIELATATDVATRATAEVVRLRKVITGGVDPEPEVHALLKGKTPEQVELLSPIIDFFESKLEKADARTLSVVKAGQTERLTALAKKYEAIGTPVDELVEKLRQAEDAGLLEFMTGQLGKVDELLVKGAGFTELGTTGTEDEIVGLGKGDTKRQEADARIEKAAVDIRKAAQGENDGKGITSEEAYGRAGEEMPIDVAIAAGMPVTIQ